MDVSGYDRDGPEGRVILAQPILQRHRGIVGPVPIDSPRRDHADDIIWHPEIAQSRSGDACGCIVVIGVPATSLLRPTGSQQLLIVSLPEFVGSLPKRVIVDPSLDNERPA